jgi:hypothetical protein
MGGGGFILMEKMTMFTIEQKYNYEPDWKWEWVAKRDLLEDARDFVNKYCKVRPTVSGLSGFHHLQTRIIDENGKTYSR